MLLNANTVQADFCDLLLGAIGADQDCTSHAVSLAQVELLILSLSSAELPADWTQRASWEALIDNQGGHVIALPVVGGIPLPDEVEIVGPRGYSEVFALQYTLSGTFTSLSDNLYALAKRLQCPENELRIWYANESHLFGGPKGIEVDTSTTRMPLPEDGYEDAAFQLTWTARHDPDRTARPFININDVSTPPTPWVDPGGNPWVDPDGNNWIWQ